MGSVDELKARLHELARISLGFRADYTPVPHFATEMHGYSEAEIFLAVCKRVQPPEFARDQAEFMRFLGPEVCPKILAVDTDSYCMEYLYPAEYSIDSLVMIERFLEKYVWSRGVIHGDPTLDNVLMTKDGFMRLTDPIPAKWLRKPSIKAVDHGKILQSLLGWEVVLRGADLIQYEFPWFMSTDASSARDAIFWAKVALERIAKRDIFDAATQWANRVAVGLEELCTLSF